MQPSVEARHGEEKVSEYEASPSYQSHFHQASKRHSTGLPAYHLRKQRSIAAQTAAQNDERDARGYTIIHFDYDDSEVMKDPVITLIR